MKKKLILVVSCLTCLCSCNGTSKEETKNPLSEVISLLREGFRLEGSIVTSVTNSNDNSHMFDNTYNYEYEFDNSSRAKVHQAINYMYNGEEQNYEISVCRDDDGYIAYETINYKNELTTYPMVDSSGYYQDYDKLFTNPFLLVFESDFLESEEENGVYLLSEDKISLVNYYLCGSDSPLIELKLSFEEDYSLVKIETTSVTFKGKSYDSTDKKYYPSTWVDKGNFELYDLGSTFIETPSVSETIENKELSDIFGKVKDNYTYTNTISILAENPEDNVVSSNTTAYFDGSGYYVHDNTASDTSSDVYYGKDLFTSDDLFYKYCYDSTSKLWVKESTDSSTSFNVTPQDKSYFIPRISEMSVSIFDESKDGDGYYVVNNEDALATIGRGFIAEINDLYYFELGYCYAAKIREYEDNIEFIVDFYFVYSSYIYGIEYKGVYSSIGETTLPDLDI